MGVLVSIISVEKLVPPLAETLQEQTDKALHYTSDTVMAICEERFDDLIELRLEEDPEMQAAYMAEAISQVRALDVVHSGIRSLIFQEGKNLLEKEDSKNISPVSYPAEEHRELGSIVESTFNGESVRLIEQYFPFWDLRVICLISKKDYNAPVIQARRIVFFGTLGVLVTVVVTLLTLFLWRINNPLSKIISATEKVANGNIVTIDIKGKDEISQVGKAFNEMVRSLESDQKRISSIMGELRDSEEQYRILTENTLAYVMVLGDRGCLFVNGRLVEALQHSSDQLKGDNFYTIIHEEDRLSLRETVSDLMGGRVEEKHFECRFLSSESKTLWVELKANRIIYREIPAILLHGNDITRSKEEQMIREKLEVQLEQAKRLEAIGTLAGGVAHDFNNMLGGIIGAAELLSTRLSNDAKAERYYRIIIESAGRAADLTEQLLTFSRTGPKTSTPIDVHEVINATLVLARNTIDKRIELKTTFTDEESTIIGDSSQLQNVFLNLCINSAHSMPEGGQITICSKVLELDEIYCTLSSFALEPGQYLEIEVRDSGKGIDPQYLPMIFDPFFTTKKQGEGTGLGLASVYGTIQQHNGAISVYSEVNVGTAFHLLLPLTSVDAVPIQTTQVLTKGSGRILVVDDEEVMRITAKAVLEDLGYEVILAKNGQQAVDTFKHQKGIDLVLLDMVMPVMNGRDCFYKLQEINPQVRVVLSSGFTREEDLKEMRQSGLKGFIRKPYRSVNLSQVIHDVLG
ncbi:hypothetical protein LA52FAK_44610 [Desulforhopalus sp. 52FAK]